MIPHPHHPHHDEEDEKNPGHLPVEPDQGPVPAGVPVDPAHDGSVDPEV